MRAMTAWPLLALLTISGCEGCGHDGPAATAGTGGEGTASVGGEGETHEGSAAVAPGPPPTLVVRIERDGANGGYPFVVENHGDTEASLRSAVLFERRDGDAWRAVDEIESVSLRMDCEHAAAERVPLAPGAALHPPAWSGKIGDAQCACERCVAAPAGDYRVVVTTDDGAHRTESNAVTVVDS